MSTKQIPDNCFRVADLAREVGVDPRFARARLRKAIADGERVPDCEKGPHVFNAAWVFLNKHKVRVTKLIQAQGVTKKAKVEAEDEEAAKDLAAE
jgi:hypothetical protein